MHTDKHIQSQQLKPHWLELCRRHDRQLRNDALAALGSQIQTESQLIALQIVSRAMRKCTHRELEPPRPCSPSRERGSGRFEQRLFEF